MATNLLSVAGLVGSPIALPTRTARVIDIVVGDHPSDTYPQITGLLVRVGRRLVFVAGDAVDGLFSGGSLRATGIDPPAFVRRTGDVLLAADVLDRQLVDADGVHVIRAADLYLAVISGTLRLVALDTSVRALVRRLGPRRMRTRPQPRHVIDWCHIAEMRGMPDVLHLSAPHGTLRRVHARELALTLGDHGGAP